MNDNEDVLLTAAELAAYLGLNASRVRHIIAEHGCAAIGKRGRAKLYWPNDVLRHTGHDDRLAKTEQTAAH